MAPSIAFVAHEFDIVIAHEPDFVDLGAFGEEMETPSIESGRQTIDLVVATDVLHRILLNSDLDCIQDISIEIVIKNIKGRILVVVWYEDCVVADVLHRWCRFPARSKSYGNDQ